MRAVIFILGIMAFITCIGFSGIELPDLKEVKDSMAFIFCIFLSLDFWEVISK